MQVSFHSSNITPPYPCWLAGYERGSKSEGVLDPIFLQSFAWKLQEDILLFFSLDCICVNTAFCEELQATISKRYGIRKEHINISCIHTHSAPAICALPTTPDAKEETLWQTVVRKTILSDCEQLLQSLQEATLAYDTFLIDGCFSNRNELDGPCDKQATLISFYQEEAIIGSIALIGVHPTVLHQENNRISSDLLGAIRKQLGDMISAPVLVWNSACGNVSTRFFRMKDAEHALQMTADSIVHQLSIPDKKQNIKEQLHASSFTLQTTFDANYDPWTQSQLTKLKAKLQAVPTNVSQKNLLHRLELKQRLHTISTTLTIHTYLIDDIIIITIPGEIISQASLELKERYPDKLVLLISYCNGYCSYLVNQKEYGKYFESYVAITPKYTYERVMDNIIQAIETLNDAQH